MALNRRTRIPVEFDAPAFEIIPIAVVEERPEEFEGGGGVNKAARRRSRLRVGLWRPARRRVRAQRIDDAFRTDSAETERCGRFTAGAASAGEMSNQSEFLPA
jgi:hypothetical protein